jgi:hypothetical protein
MNVLHGNPGAIPEHTPDVRAACPDCKRITAFLKAYREFGYSTLTWEECRASYEAAMDPAGHYIAGDIIAMFMRRELVDAGLLPSPSEEARA